MESQAGNLVVQYVVNLAKFEGHAHTILYDGKCPYTGKCEEDFRREGYAVLTYDELYPHEEKYLDSLCGQWQEISEEHYNDQLSVLPPLAWFDGGFFISERYTFDVTAFYQRRNKRYYTSLQRLSYARAAILDSLARFITETADVSRNQDSPTEVM